MKMNQKENININLKNLEILCLILPYVNKEVIEEGVLPPNSKCRKGKVGQGCEAPFDMAMLALAYNKATTTFVYRTITSLYIMKVAGPIIGATLGPC